jgi:malate dehydrogenase (oxaloacetate-decarboxylating)(NADP+)
VEKVAGHLASGVGKFFNGAMSVKADFREQALSYHRSGSSLFSKPGKLEISPTKSLITQKDLSYAYTPGVAEPCLEIARDPQEAYQYTIKGNLVAVITNGTAVLGLGNIGPLAAKPVMEGKAVLFKKFADIDCFDLEVKSGSIDDFVKVVQSLEPTFGGINLEDISAPDCFEIERRLRESMSIPVFHDDQHGTAIISGAALLNALEVSGKKIDQIRVVFCGGGAASIACAKFWLSLGVKKENCIMTDKEGVVFKGRGVDMNPEKDFFALEGSAWHKKAPRTLAEAMKDSDVFMGCSVANVVTPDMLKSLRANPIVFAMANPHPEISYDAAIAARKDMIFATGRSDFPNQINNVLCYPFIFRGALDVRARTINEEMKIAAAQALASLAKEDVPEEVMNAYGVKCLKFGKDYIIPKPFDPRVFLWVAPAVAKAAIDSGVAQAGFPGDSIEAYTVSLDRKLGKTRSVMQDQRQRLFRLHKGKKPVRMVLPEGHNEKILRAAAIMRDEKIAEPVLLGEHEVIADKIAELGLSTLKSCEVIRPSKSELFAPYASKLYEVRKRKGMAVDQAQQLMKDPFYFAAMLVEEGHCDVSLSGITRPYRDIILPNLHVIGARPGKKVAGVYMLIWRERVLFLADTTVNIRPNSQDLADIAIGAANVARVMGFEPRVAMLSFASFGSNRDEEALRVSQAVSILQEKHPDFIVDGEMQADLAVNAELLAEKYPFCRLSGKEANVLVFPNLSSANTSYKLLGQLSDCEMVGPILVGMKKPVHILQSTADVSQIVNMGIIAALEAANRAAKEASKS